MPKLCELFNEYLVYMYCEKNSQHKLPHIHIRKSGIDISFDFNGNILDGETRNVPSKDIKKITRWIRFHQGELVLAWQKVTNGQSPETISNIIPPREEADEHGMHTGESFAQDLCSVYSAIRNVSVVEVLPLPAHFLLCSMNNGATVLYEMSEWLLYPAFAPLFDMGAYKRISVVFGNPTWVDINEEITATDIFTDGIVLRKSANIRFLKFIAKIWNESNDAVVSKVVKGFVEANNLAD